MYLRKDIKIFVGNTLGSVKRCPTVVVSNNPCFKWILPDDLKGRQTRFCLQIKSHTPHILSSGERDFAFYQSGDVESEVNSFEVNYGTTGLLHQSWAGTIAVRLFISTIPKKEIEENNIKMPYEYVSDEAYVLNTEWQNDPFNIETNDRYFVFDDKSETFINSNEVICRWKNSVDINNDKLKYIAEISKSPTFKSNMGEIIQFEINDNAKTYSRLETYLEQDNSYFFRVRAFDGLDYSDWSYVHGFTLTTNEKPVAEILSLEFLEEDGIRNGDIKIHFRVTDTKQNIVSLNLLYSGGCVQFGERATPNILEALHTFVIDDENKGYGTFTWKSLTNEKIDADDFFLYFRANDGIDESDEFIYGAFSIYNESIFKHKTAGGSYFLTFNVMGELEKTDEFTSKNYFDNIPVIGREAISVEHAYFGYQNDGSILNNVTIYGHIFPENEFTFCVKSPRTIYKKVYHHGKYMIYDYDIPVKMEDKDLQDDGLNTSNGATNEKENEKLEKDPYVVAPEYNPTLNVDEPGVNKYIIYSSKEKLEDIDKEIGKSKPLPNGEWYSEIKQKGGMYHYIQKWGAEFKADYGLGAFVLEDGGNAPQYTLNVDDLDETGYPKPISYSEYERIGEDKTIYIKKYRIENGFAGNAKNFTVVNNNGKWERKYFACRGLAPEIVYENNIPYISYGGKLINKYDKEEIKKAKEKGDTKNISEIVLNLPEDSIYIPKSVWGDLIKYQHIAVPYYVPSTEAIYRPGDHKAGVVGKNEPIIIDGTINTVKRVYGNVKEVVPALGELYPLPRKNEVIGKSKSNEMGIFLSPDNSVFIREEDKTFRFIDTRDDLYTFLSRNRDVIIEFNEKTTVIYRFANFTYLTEEMAQINPNRLDSYGYPYYVCGVEKEDSEPDENGLRDIEIKYFILSESADFENNATKTLEINVEERLYYAFSKGGVYLLPQDCGISVNGELIKKQRYLPKDRNTGKPYEKFDFIDYVCRGKFLQGETMYYAGVNGWLGREVVDDFNRAIKFICNIKLADKLQELKIIYLQYYWDSYNQIHWTGNLSSKTYARIEYTKLENGKELGWKDLKFEKSIYSKEINAWLVKPQSFSALIDNFNYKQFDDACQYRMRISGVNFEKDVINAIGPVIATPDFTIDDDVVNPFVIESMNYDVWTKKLEINFRVDDLQGDLYDIVSLRYTADDKVWYNIQLSDVDGQITNLKSNTLKNRETEQIITHTIHWYLGGYVMRSSEIRIQIKGTLSKYNLEFDFPFFTWICWDNQKWKKFDDEDSFILGKWIRTEKVTNKDGSTSWKPLNTPVRQSGGEMERTSKAINEIKQKYQNYLKTATENVKSYDEWLLSNYEGGVTYALRIQSLMATQKDLQERLQNAKKYRYEAELFTRKELIKQGFYCNGFINNDPENYVFEYRVLNLPSRGHASTIDWGSEADTISDLNGNFTDLVSLLENGETLKDNGFKIVYPFPNKVIVNEDSFPAKMEITKDSSDPSDIINYFHINNTLEEIPNRTEIISEVEYIKENGELIEIYNEKTVEIIEDRVTEFHYLLHGSKYNVGKYSFSVACYTNNPQEENTVQIYLERYKAFKYDDEELEEYDYLNDELSLSSEDELTVIDNGVLFDTILLKEMIVKNNKPSVFTSYYDENSETLLDDLKYSKLVFKVKGDLYFTSLRLKVGEVWEDIGGDTYFDDNSKFIVKGRVGARQTGAVKNNFPSIGTIGQHLADLEYIEELDAADKYTVYYRFQLDSLETFDSQRFGNPLRDIIYSNTSKAGNLLDSDEERTRISGGKLVTNPVLVNKDVMLSTNPEVVTEIEKIREESKKLETETAVTGTVQETGLSLESNNDKRKTGNFIIPKVDLPGEWKGVYLNTSFPEYYDQTTFDTGSFNGEYFWRVAPYNVVECDYEEVSHSIVTKVSTLNNSADIQLIGYSNENIEELKLNGNFWYRKSEVTPYWSFDWSNNDKKTIDSEYKRSMVVFPTDAPLDENGDIILGENAIAHIPYSIDRIRPFVIKDELEFNYYMFCSKTGSFGSSVITQSMGKGWKKFGELSQIYPKYINENYPALNEQEKFVSMFSPCALFVQSDEELKKTIYVWATAQMNDGKLNTVMFKSDLGKVDFSNPIICNGLQDTYHHCVIKYEDKFLMVCCKTYLQRPSLFTYISNNGITWESISPYALLFPEREISSPCINKEGDVYKIYLTEWQQSKSKIVSYETVDFITVSNRKVELDNTFSVKVGDEEIIYNNPKNPCVIDDVYLGEKIKRMYYNVDMILGDKKETIIKTMFLESGEWIKLKGEVVGKNEISSSVFGIENTVNVNFNTPISFSKVRLDVELSDVYTKMPKECILQSDWITKDNCIEFDADISPDRNYIYSSMLKERKYTGE